MKIKTWRPYIAVLFIFTIGCWDPPTDPEDVKILEQRRTQQLTKCRLSVYPNAQCGVLELQEQTKIAEKMAICAEALSKTTATTAATDTKN